MEKTKNLTRKAGKYLRELSVVVIGVAITLSASNWLSSRSEKKDTVLYLNALKLELERDTIAICNLINHFEKSASYARYILSCNKQSLNPDTIQNYRNTCYTVFTYAPQTSAFEMLKTTGNMRFINNKEMLQSIWNAYFGMEDLKSQVDMFFQCKDREIDKDVQFELENGKPVDIPMYGFYIRERDANMLEMCREELRILKETLSKLYEITP